MKDLKQAARGFLLNNDTVFRVNSQTVNGLCEFVKHLVDKGVLVEGPFNSDVNENCERAKWLMTNRLFDTEEYGEHPDVCELYGIIEDLQKTVQSTKYHQSAEVKSLDECELIVLSRYGFKSWNEAMRFYSTTDVLKKAKEAAEMYADQFKVSKIITDEDIKAHAIEAYPEENRVTQRLVYEFGAKWYRDQLNKQ